MKQIKDRFKNMENDDVVDELKKFEDNLTHEKLPEIINYLLQNNVMLT